MNPAEKEKSQETSTKMESNSAGNPDSSSIETRVDQDTTDQQQDQQQSQQPSGSKKAETTRMLRTFDRLTPRYCDDNKNKRKATMSNSADEDTASAAKKAAVQSGGAKKEYSKLKTLVPALTEREDLSKVEIIEETIRYIDALHHQLANRGINPPNQSLETEEQQTQQQPETNPENTSAEPLKALLSGDSSVPRPRRIAAATGAQASGSSNISAETSNTVAPSSVITSTSSERSSTGDVKAAVENIQAMFAAYLENHRSTNNSSSDDSNS